MMESRLFVFVFALAVLALPTSAGRDVRLVGGAHACEGRVEVLHAGQWGTVCDDGWELNNAAVVCRQLGCGSAVSAPGGARFGPGSGPVWLDGVSCEGTEVTLSRCVSEGWSNMNCDHSEDAGVICSAEQGVRLASGIHLCFGRVEVLSEQTWGTVCETDLDWPGAEVICRQESCGRAKEVLGGAYFGEGWGLIRAEVRRCRGDETHLSFCPLSTRGNQSCTHRSDVSVLCTGYTGLRLVGGPDPCSGRVELQWRGEEWAGVCGRHWDLREASVLCRQLDCGVAVAAAGPGALGVGSGAAWRDHFDCEGSEDRLMACRGFALGQGECPPGARAEVTCSGSSFPLRDVRLSAGASRCEGRVEVHHGGTWGRVVQDSWGPGEASVVCRQLGCGAAVDVFGSSQYGTGEGSVCLTGIRCSGGESHLGNCSSPRAQRCRTESSVAVVCSHHRALRLAGGPDGCAGRLEVYHRGSWGTVCDDSWGPADSQVVCRQLQCGTALGDRAQTSFGPGTGQIWLDEVGCAGNESSLWECPSAGWGQHDCGHKEDVAVVCSEHKQLRLSGGCSGQVELFYNGSWGSVCSNNMTDLAAAVICHQLGCGDGAGVGETASRLTGAPRWLDDIQCRRQDSALWQCPSSPWGQTACRDNEVAEITCSDHRALQLAGGPDGCAGRLEVYHRGSWGTVCDDSWGPADSQVVCRQLQCGTALGDRAPASFGPGTGQIWLDEVGCSGNESSLWECPSAGWGQHDCGHKEDVAVVCSGESKDVPRYNTSLPGNQTHERNPELALRLVGPSHCSGRVEVRFEGSWGTVCDDSWDLQDAQVVCRQLGCGAAVRAVGNGSFGRGHGAIWLDEVKCAGDERHLWDCRRSPLGQGNCAQKEDAGVVCTEVLPGGGLSMPLAALLPLGLLLLGTLLALAWQTQQNRQLRTVVARREIALWQDAVYEELDHKLYTVKAFGPPRRGRLLFEEPPSDYNDVEIREGHPNPGKATPLLKEEAPNDYDDVFPSSQGPDVVSGTGLTAPGVESVRTAMLWDEDIPALDRTDYDDVGVQASARGRAP